MIKHITFAIAICFAVFDNVSGYALRCRVCHRATSYEACDAFVECTPDEVCYMDEIVTTYLAIVYNAGCRAKDTCVVASQRRRRASGDLLACTTCCNNEDYCNEYLCNIQRATNLTICNSCGNHVLNEFHSPAVRYPEDCAHTTVCAPNEMCYTKTIMTDYNNLKHITQCMDAKVCILLMNYIFMGANADTSHLIGKRVERQNICSACCGDDRCNQYACETIKRRLIQLHKDGLLDMHTMKEIF